SVGPALSGALLGTGFSGLPFVISGTLKTVYDLVLLFAFRHIKPPEEQDRGSPSNNSGSPARHNGQQAICQNRFSGGMRQ
ncbi:MAG: hypothetical protein WAV78_36080, partial [Xanthobacteraceae bacterium]